MKETSPAPREMKSMRSGTMKGETGMTKKKAKPGLNELPPVKPWCYRVARTAAKKYGARENWPQTWREKCTNARRAKRRQQDNPAIEELLLIAESKAGGLEGQIARAKLRVLKMQQHISAEAMRSQILARLMRASARRNSKVREDDAGERNEEP